MENQFEQALAKAVEQALQLAEKTGTFVLDQAPELIRQFLLWNTWSHILGIVLGLFLFLIARYLPYLWLKKEKGRYDNKFFSRYGDEEGFGFNWAFFTIFSLVGLFIIVINIHDLVYITVAPKLYTIDYFIS